MSRDALSSWVGQVGTAAPIVPPQKVRSEKLDVVVSDPVVEIDKYLWYDDGKLVKVLVRLRKLLSFPCFVVEFGARCEQIEMEGIGALPADSVKVDFEKRRAVASIHVDGKIRRLTLFPLSQEIDPATSSFVRKPTKLIVRLAKVDGDKTWFDLLSKKPTGDDDE